MCASTVGRSAIVTAVLSHRGSSITVNWLRCAQETLQVIRNVYFHARHGPLDLRGATLLRHGPDIEESQVKAMHGPGLVKTRRAAAYAESSILIVAGRRHRLRSTLVAAASRIRTLRTTFRSHPERRSVLSPDGACQDNSRCSSCQGYELRTGRQDRRRRAGRTDSLPWLEEGIPAIEAISRSPDAVVSGFQYPKGTTCVESTRSCASA